MRRGGMTEVCTAVKRSCEEALAERVAKEDLRRLLFGKRPRGCSCGRWVIIWGIFTRDGYS